MVLPVNEKQSSNVFVVAVVVVVAVARNQFSLEYKLCYRFHNNNPCDLLYDWHVIHKKTIYFPLCEKK